MTAGLGQQRHVVAKAEILETTAQIDDLHPVIGFASRLLQVFKRGDDILRWVVGTPVGQLFDNDDKAAHGTRAF